ncbi:uncharacterized protein LOC131016252 [Salvia miltiorrhiza]|uniref:uncharacterized protein LOC131016252 n=1 Tax=Salvia miltiorrhiza TaxID=226208 RepID=UPI0025AD6288|nr:uncharacterized protein LOC131016252 [Salvia miltiorrhiza]XP_057800888.1 uncharacterized protein LOC131016252 [Salvia miltiorrhiza]
MKSRNSPMALLFFILAEILLSSTAAAPPSANITNILSTLGFHDLSAAGGAANLSGATPTTVFAPTDSSLLTCRSCSTALLLQEHAVPGLYPLHFLRRLAFGTKIESFAANRCLTVTASASSTARKVFINGVEIAKPDFFNNGLVVVHALQGYVSHLSPLSCAVETMTTLSFPQQPPPAASFSIMRLMLKDAMRGLRIGGYSIVALAIRLKFAQLLDLNSLTLFAIDDVSVFVDGGRGGGGGQMYVAEMGFHIVPNRLLTAADLMRLPNGTALPTMQRGRNLVVTSAGGGGPLAPMRINFVKLDRFDLLVNKRIAVHGLTTPFRDVHRQWFSGHHLGSVAAGVPVMQ